MNGGREPTTDSTHFMMLRLEIELNLVWWEACAPTTALFVLPNVQFILILQLSTHYSVLILLLILFNNIRPQSFQIPDSYKLFYYITISQSDVIENKDVQL